MWLAAGGKPPPSAEIAVAIKSSGASLGDYRPVCSLVLKNTGSHKFESCLAQMIEWSNPTPDRMPIPFSLRTDGQIRDQQHGPFVLLPSQDVMIPLVFHSPIRANEWLLFDEHGQRYFVPADPMKLLLRIHGGLSPGAAVAFINTDAGWNAMPSIETVPMDFVLNRPPT
jgi:hypothetical protein